MLIKNTTDNSIEILAPAKINLFLQVLNKRSDGYHNINSLFQAVTLFDKIVFAGTEEPECRIKFTGNSQPLENNLIAKAYELLKSRFSLTGGIDVTLEKKIPIAAGLGGGSSDCAAAIAAIDNLFGLGMDKSAMSETGAELGSDVPFFFTKGQALITGRGEIIKETAFPIDYKIVLISPPLSLSTKEGYGALKMDLTSNVTPFNLKSHNDLNDFFGSIGGKGNDFEKVQFEKHPELGEIREKLVNCGAVFARMSGSGPTIFGVFPKSVKTERVCVNNFADCQLYTIEPFCLP